MTDENFNGPGYSFKATVSDAGGGVVKLYVHRDTSYYPDDGTEVRVTVLSTPTDPKTDCIHFIGALENGCCADCGEFIGSATDATADNPTTFPKRRCENPEPHGDHTWEWEQERPKPSFVIRFCPGRGVVEKGMPEWEEHDSHPAYAELQRSLKGEGVPDVPTEPLDAQVDRLAKFIMAQVPGEPSQSEGAIDTAIRLLSQNVALHGFLRHIASILGLGEVESYDDVCNAVERLASTEASAEQFTSHIEWDAKRETWRLVVPETGEIRECKALHVLVAAIYSDATWALRKLRMPHEDIELFFALANDLTDFVRDHAECSIPVISAGGSGGGSGDASVKAGPSEPSTDYPVTEPCPVNCDQAVTWRIDGKFQCAQCGREYVEATPSARTPLVSPARLRQLRHDLDVPGHKWATPQSEHGPTTKAYAMERYLDELLTVLEADDSQVDER